jgi:thymidine kinase
MLTNNLELITGPVCCGKSAELIKRIDRYSIAGYNVLVLKPKLDTRSSRVTSRNGSEVECFEIEKAFDVYDIILDLSLNEHKNIDIIAFDEGQFFNDLYDISKDLLHKEFKVIVSALDSDFNGNPFGDITKLVILSDNINKMTAICMKCKKDNAIFSQKLKVGGDQIEIGNLELYHPRCINCFVPGGITDNLEEASSGTLF